MKVTYKEKVQGVTLDSLLQCEGFTTEGFLYMVLHDSEQDIYGSSNPEGFIACICLNDSTLVSFMPTMMVRPCNLEVIATKR